METNFIDSTSGMGAFNMFVGLFSIVGLLLWLVPIVFVVWFAITTVKQLKKQSMLLEEINEKLKR